MKTRFRLRHDRLVRIIVACAMGVESYTGNNNGRYGAFVLQNMGDVALGVVTTHHYSAAATRPANQAFVKAYKAAFGANEDPSFLVADAYDGMAAIFHVIIAQQGKIDPEKTMELLKGWKDDASPRGPIMIDPETRDVIQNEYMRRVERVNGALANVEFETMPMVKDPWKEINKQK